MKILHIIQSLDPEGGPIESVLQLARIYKANSHSIEVLSLDAPDGECVKNCALKVHAVGPGLGLYDYSNKFKPWLDAHAQHYDIFIINGIWQYHSFAARSVLKSKKRPYYLLTHAMMEPWFKHQYPLKHLKKWLYWPWGEYPVSA